MNKTLRYGTSALIALLVVSAVTYGVSAWQSPGTAPTGGNVSGPVTVGSGAQTKNGNFTIGSGYSFTAPQICLSNDPGVKCRTVWPSGGGSNWTRSGTLLYNTNTGDNVGVGTTNPTTKFMVQDSTNGSLTFGNQSYSGALGNWNVFGTVIRKNSTGNPEVVMGVGGSGGNAPGFSASRDGKYVHYYLRGDTTQGAWFSTNSPGFNFTDQYEGISRLFIRSNDGYIGMGTNAPTARIDIRDTGANLTFGTQSYSGALGAWTLNGIKVKSTNTGTPEVVMGIGGSGGNAPGVSASRDGKYLHMYMRGTVSEGAYLDTNSNSISLATNETKRLTVLNNGNVGIGNTSPWTNLAVTGTIAATGNLDTTADVWATRLCVKNKGCINDVLNTNRINMGDATNIFFGTTGTAIRGGVNVNIMPSSGRTNFTNTSASAYTDIYFKDAYANGAWVASDVRLKKDIQTYRNALGTVLAMRGVTYKLKATNQTAVGFIAQEIETLVPEMITTNSGTGMKAVSYDMAIPILVEAVKEQQTQIETLEERIEALEKMLAE
jgi:hypothetical protein